MKKVLTVIPTLTGGGAERVCLRLHEHFLKSGIESHIIVLSQKVTYEHQSFKNIHILPFKHVKNLELFGKSKRVARALQGTINMLEKDGIVFDAIYSHLDESNVVVNHLKTQTPCFYVVHISTCGELNAARERGLLKYWRLKNKKKALNGKSVVAVSEGAKNDLEKISWLHPKRVTTIYNPINQEHITQLSHATDDAELLPEEPYIVHMGRFAKAKRHDVLLDAFKKVVAQKPSLKLVLLVNPTEKVKQAIAARQLQENVILPGFIENPFPWIRNAQLLVLSSSYEGFPNVLVESLVCRTPFVSTDCDHGPREITHNFAPNWLVPVGDVDALAEKIIKFTADRPTVNLEQWPLLENIQPDFAMRAYLSLSDA
ncbi:MAG: glycosyltransferase [Alteromonadaceae bacterium]|nr:glycosyltransferase [Alteromonadaceae bacterium]